MNPDLDIVLGLCMLWRECSALMLDVFHMAWFHIITFAGTVRPAEHRALLYAAEWLEHFPHIGVRLLLSQHAHKQLPVF